VKRAGRDGDPAGGAANPERASRLIKRTDVAQAPISLRDAGGENRSRQPVKGSGELPVPTALVRQAARAGAVADGQDTGGRGGREPDFATWRRLTAAQRSQSKWRERASKWQRAAAAKAGLLAALAGHDRPQRLSFSVDEARRLLGSEPDAAAPLIGALRPSVDPQELPVTSGLFLSTDDEETPTPPRGEA
jgi:hypothetical protein